ncbi:MAG: dethiobiotin synthase [Gammaproteobacteria bacterium]|nr:dethiobiotin synthase [Gammaproteobacteria bacterium]
MKIARGYFVTATDTGAGKTFVAAALIQALVRAGWRVAALKPVASGCRRDAGALVSGDARRLHAQVNVPQSLQDMTQYAFAPAISPHLAAATAGVRIGWAPIRAALRAQARQADTVIVEGVGGWLAPLGSRASVADLAVALRLPVICVVGLRLGALNHALLTVQSIAAYGMPLAGFVVDVRDPRMAYRQGNIDTLKRAIDAPCLGIIPPGASVRHAAGCLDLYPLLAVSSKRQRAAPKRCC